MDMRTAREMFSWSLVARGQYFGFLKCLAPTQGLAHASSHTGDKEVAVGTGNGSIVTMDQRTGFINLAFKAHDAAIVQVGLIGLIPDTASR